MGWEKQVVDPDGPCQSSREANRCLERHRAGSTTSANIYKCTNVSYFVTRTAGDGMPAGDFKSMNNSACSLYHCGHVQQVEA